MKPARSDRFLRMIASAALATALAASAASAMGPAGTAAAADAAGVAAATGAAAAARAHCDRACLYAILDRYLDALVAHDPSRLSWSPHVKYTENNVALRVGDGLWGSTLGFDKFAVRFADPQTGDIGYDGIVREADAASPFALRLKVVAGAVAEAEAIVARPKEAGIAFVNTVRTPIPSLEAILPPSERSSRARMIALADGYFSTLQQNDGHLHTVFDPDCNRNEDGFQTTNHPGTPYGFIMGLGCAEQFRLGFYRFDDRVRDRRYLVIDEERGLILAGGFIDHSGRTTEYRLTDGRQVKANIAHPNSLSYLETFRIRAGKIQQVESVFTSVPYRMPSPWVGAGFHYE
ncbi:MAG TPA: hypothetical protein VN730_12460 [Steroidobacteraceae bacterium]|nr:hypothetical protein [Steroidobacteraceae bacterium]